MSEESANRNRKRRPRKEANGRKQTAREVFMVEKDGGEGDGSVLRSGVGRT